MPTPPTFPPQPVLRTICVLPPYPWSKWEAGQTILSMGSCFADHIGQRLVGDHGTAGLATGVSNPLGVIFNPVSLVRCLTWSAAEFGQEVVKGQQGWVSYHAHSRFASPDPTTLSEKLSTALQARDLALQQPDPVLILTLGTAWVWELKEDQGGAKFGPMIVANCQKQPSHLFDRRLLEVHEITEAIMTLKATYPHARVILTVSPVRHTRETLVGNSASKATLRVACHWLAERHPETFYYFPAYELVLDDLRDYRFFEADMIHPNGIAIDYVWQALLSQVAAPSFMAAVAEADQRAKRVKHRPIVAKD